MRLQSYLEHLENTLRSRRELKIEYLLFRASADVGVFRAEVSFYDGSRLIVREELRQDAFAQEIERLLYSFHYQSADGMLIFRYDDAPHYPELATFPHHKHVPGDVVEAEPPDLTDVLREIDERIYPRS